MEGALGVAVTAHDDNSRPGMYDLRIDYPDRDPGAVEVTAAADPAALELWRIINAGEQWVEDGLVGGWAVGIDRHADARRLRRELPMLLKELEARGWQRLERRYPPHRLELYARELGVVRVWRSPTTSVPGSIYVTIHLPNEQTGGFISDSTDAVASWIGLFLYDDKRSRVRRKLALSGASERHAFVVVVGFADADFSVTEPLMREGAPLPSHDPTLPDEITDVWLASTWSAGVGFRYSTSMGWSTFSKK
jgi:hypothetical protein